MSMSTSSVFKWVVDDVISKMKPETVQEGVDECVSCCRARSFLLGSAAPPSLPLAAAARAQHRAHECAHSAQVSAG